jgi:hypothetical protein
MKKIFLRKKNNNLMVIRWSFGAKIKNPAGGH